MIRVVRPLLSAVLVIAALAACERGDTELALHNVVVPTAAESLAPQVFKVDGRVSLSWLERTEQGDALRYATWTGDGWSEARQVASGENWFANWADLPGVRPLRGGGWVAWWLQKSAPSTYAYDVQLAFSADGTSWAPYGPPHSDGTPTEHGFVTAFDLPEGGLGLAWLDGRNTAGNGHEAHGAGGMTLRYALFDGKGELRDEAQFDGLTCDCCQTDSAATSDGIVMVYRDRTENEIRDIFTARLVNGRWSEPSRVHADGWKIDGCPVNGPAVVADGERVGVAWFTAPEGKGEVRFAWSKDGGRTFGPPIRIDDGRPLGRVDAVIDPDGTALVSWVEQGGDGADVRMRSVGKDGDTGKSTTLVRTTAGRAAGFPRMIVLDDGRLLVTWTATDGATRKVRSAVVALQASALVIGG